MPGGRGDLLDIAAALNEEKHDKIKDAIKMTIEDDGYRISGVTINVIAAAYTKCNNPDSLTDLYCFALEHKAVDWANY